MGCCGEALIKVPDPRHKSGVRYPFSELLLAIVCAVISGAKMLTMIAGWGQTQVAAAGHMVRKGDGYRELKASTSVLIAYCEREWSANGVRRILSTGTVDVVGIDAGRAEGITGFVGAVHSIEAASKQVDAHAFAGPSSYAAGLAVSLTTTACRQFEVAPLRNELMIQLAPSLEVPRGSVTVLPGHVLGAEIDRGAVDLVAAMGASPR